MRSSDLVHALKRRLKANSITYNDLAQRLGLSESAVKQMFAGGNFSLRRLDEVCDALALDVASLVDVASAEQPELDSLQLEQEQELVSDMHLLLVAYCLVNHWKIEEIRQRYRIDEPQLVGLLVKLDHMKLIELLPDNRVRLRVSANFTWHENGPIERFFRDQVQHEFLRDGFHDEGALRVVRSGHLSADSRRQLLERIETVGRLYDELSAQERRLPLSERKGMTMMLAMRNWQFTAFSEMER